MRRVCTSGEACLVERRTEARLERRVSTVGVSTGQRARTALIATLSAPVHTDTSILFARSCLVFFCCQNEHCFDIIENPSENDYEVKVNFVLISEMNTPF